MMMRWCHKYKYAYYDNSGNSPLEPYIKNHSANSKNSIWTCPDLATYYQNSTVDYHNYPRTYSMNEFLTGAGGTYQCTSKTSTKGCVNVSDPDSYYPRVSDEGTKTRTDKTLSDLDNPITLASIGSPANTDLLYETMTEDGDSSVKFTGSSQGYGSWQWVKGFWNSSADELKFWYAAQSPDQPYHNSTNDYLFCDGHVKARRPEKQGYDVTKDPNQIWTVQDGRDGKPFPATPQ